MSYLAMKEDNYVWEYFWLKEPNKIPRRQWHLTNQGRLIAIMKRKS